MGLRFRDSAVYLAQCLGLALLYYGVGRYGRIIDFAEENNRVLLPQSGVALAGLTAMGVRCWPGVLIGSLLTTRLAVPPVDLSMAVGFACGNTMSAAVGAWGLHRFAQFDCGLRRLRDLYSLLFFGVLLAPLVSATVAVGAYAGREHLDPGLLGGLWTRRWFGHGISNLVLTPVLLVWMRPPASPWSGKRLLEGALLLSALLFVCQGVFLGQSAIRQLTYPLSFAPFPFVIWSALRFGPRGAATTTVAVAMVAIYGLSKGQGPFMRLAPDQPLIILQVYILAVAISALFLGAAIAERQASEAALLATQEQLRALSARVEASREEERARISREVHDELGQVLTGLKMGLHRLMKKLPREDAELQRKGTALLKLNDEAVQAVRRIATDLRPGILDDLGLGESLQWLVRDFEDRTGMTATFSGGTDGISVDKERSTALFRIAQEALTNIARHAQAETVNVTLEDLKGWLVLTVEDDGVGLPVESPRAGALGLVGMRERATLLGGSLEVGSRTDGDGGTGTGTRVTARIPVS